VSEQSVDQDPAGRNAVDSAAVQRRADGASSRRRGVAGWADPRGRRLGGWAFILNRVTGLGILVYLFLHLIVLSLLARGPSAWDDFVSIALSPVFLLFDVVLIFGLLVHGLNGIRVTLVGFGLVVDRQRAMFVALMVLGAIILIVAALRIFEVG
jgi:succinate dehydrogenase / fumarate reductase cytochrome b subunit